jgi:hypothetical protein
MTRHAFLSAAVGGALALGLLPAVSPVALATTGTPVTGGTPAPRGGFMTSGTVEVTSLAGDRYRIDAQGSGSAALISSIGHPSGRTPTPVSLLDSAEGTRIDAVPVSARHLVMQGKIDPALFDLSRQAATPAAPLRVTVHYTTGSTSAETASAAEALPASDFVPGTATDSQATVAVDATRPESLWAAVTDPACKGLARFSPQQASRNWSIPRWILRPGSPA